MTDFMNPWGLYLFAFLVPLIILYLLRPKPRELKIPSLMFIVEIETKKRFSSFLRRIVRDPLLLLQIIAISLLVLAIADPFYLSIEPKHVDEDVVIILDVSASMNAGNPTRFQQAMDVAGSVMSGLDDGDRVSVVMAENLPVVVLREGTRSEAESVLQKIGPRETPTGIGGAIMLAADMLKESKRDKRIVAISDFSSYVGTDPLAARKMAISGGIDTELIRVGGREVNIGIVDAESGRTQDGCFMDLLVKNYASTDKAVEARLLLDGGEKSSDAKTVNGGTTGLFHLSSPCSASEHEASARLLVDDGLVSDNAAYAIIPGSLELDVLLILGEGADKNIKHALESLDGVSLSESAPPIYPQDYGAYETVVFQYAEPEHVLAGTFLELENYVRNGGNLVVMGFGGLADVPAGYFGDILPVEPVGVSDSGGNPSVLFDHRIFRDVDLDGVRMYKYLESNEKVGSITLAKSSSWPVVSMWTLGKGKVVYMGVSSDPSWSNFPMKPSFPIFWYNLLQWLNMGDSDKGDANFKTGDYFPAANTTLAVRTPSGDIVEGKDVVFDETGFYVVEGTGQKIAATLEDEAESDVSHRIESGDISDAADVTGAGGGEARGGYGMGVSREEETHELFWLLALAALFLILFEWFYYKRRGSLD